MQEYMDFNGKACLEYVEKDTTLVGRDKEQYKARHRTLQKMLDEAKNEYTK